MATKTHVYDGSSWRTIKKIYAYDAAATAWRLVRYSWVHDGTNWRQVHTNAFIYNETITTPTSNYDLIPKLTTAGWNGTDDVEASITINPAVVVYSTSTPQAAFKISSALPIQSIVTLRNQGTIVGMGGAGGAGKGVPQWPVNYPAAPFDGNAGSPGGTALFVSSPIILNNTGGTIAGGGGGGGGGAARDTTRVVAGAKYASDHVSAGGSGGGGGAGSGSSPSSGGSKGDTPNIAGYVQASPIGAYTMAGIPVDGLNGNAGNDSEGALAAGQTASLGSGATPRQTIISGSGGAGGGRGFNGSSGGDGSTPVDYGVVPFTPPSPGQSYPTVTGTGGSGGVAGAAISGNPYLTVPVPQEGTIIGPRV